MADARRPLISGNWKMHNNHFEAIQSVQKLAYLLPKETTEVVEVSIHPPFTDLRSIQTLIDADDLPFALGAQHCHWEDKGAFTGEVSPAFLAKLDVKYVIAGHSERRELFGETDDMVAAKVTAIQKLGMAAIACVGETLEEREAGDTDAKVGIQYGGSVKSGNIAELMAQKDIDGALVGGASLDPDEFAKIVAYGA
jgi:triosephosphate isomerase